MIGSNLFRDRVEAGRLLADEIERRNYVDPVVLALPRGGIPLAVEIGRRLNAPVDLVLVRKIGHPLQPELAVGAVVDGKHPEIVYNDPVIEMSGLTRASVDDQAASQLDEIERRRRLYFHDRDRVEIASRTAIVVDDGIATGATARAALHALRRRAPRLLVLAVPVAPADTVAELKSEVDDLICLSQPDPFFAIGVHYRDFHQLTDNDVIVLLAETDSLSEVQAASSTE
ncbi:MAG: phosphoribosyltransferase [Hyphomicrobiaceae bacterium]